MNVPVCGFLFASLLLMASVSPGQSPPKAQPQARPSPTLTAQESSLMRNTALTDARVQQVVGAGQTRVLLGEAVPDKAEAIAFYKGETQKPPTHHVWATVFNPKTNKAAEIFISLEQNTILKVQEIKATDVPLTRDDVDEALALAKAAPDVRQAVGSRVDQFVVLDPGATQKVPLEAQSLRVRGADPNDPCTLDRCLDLLFKTDTGYLPLRAAVDLTKHTVTVKTNSGKGKHP
jgi:hypothetical protein